MSTAARKMDSSKPPLSQRDLLKVDAVLAGAAMFPWGGLADLLRAPQSPVEYALFQHLNLTPDLCKIQIHAGDHNILDATMEVVHSMGATILTGEFNPLFLTGSLTADPAELAAKADMRNTCTRPGEGSSPEQSAANARNLQDFITQGGTIVTADSVSTVLDSEKLRHLPKDTYADRAALAASGLAILLASLKILEKGKGDKNKKRNSGFSAKDYIKLAPLFIFAAGASVAGGMALASTMNCDPATVSAEEKLGRMPEVEEIAREEVQFEEFLARLKGEPPVMGYYEGLDKVRNLHMAYNIWRVASESVAKGQNSVNIVAKHGRSHGEVEDLFLEGPEVLGEELKVYMGRVARLGEGFSNSVKDSLLTAGRNGDISSAEFDPISSQWGDYVSTIANYINFFQETTKVGDDPILTPRSIEASKRVPSARVLMFRELVKEIETDDGKNDGSITSKKGMLKSALMLVTARSGLLENDLQDAKASLNGMERHEEVLGEIDLSTLSTIWFDQSTKGMVDKSNYTINEQLIVGCVEFNGRVCPIIREFTVAEGKVIGQDKILLGNDTSILSGKQFEYTQNKPDSIPAEFVDSVSLKSEFSTSKVEETDNNVDPTLLSSEGVFWAQDASDLAKIDVVQIK